MRRDSAGRFSAAVEPAAKPKPPTHYRVITFRRPRGPWRSSRDEAFEDAKQMKLTAYDRDRREHYLAVPTAIEAFTGFTPPEGP